MRRGTARHERSNLSKKSSGLLPEAEEAARIDQRIAGYLADLDATDATETDDADAERTAAALGELKARRAELAALAAMLGAEHHNPSRGRA